MRRIFLGVFPLFLILAGCASDSPLVNRPLYLDQGRYPLPVYRTFRSPLVDRSSGVTEHRSFENPSDNPVQSVAAGLLSSGLSLAQNPDYFESNYVSGHCLCRRSPQETLEFPCPSVRVVLADVAGKELDQVQTMDGEFVFPARKEESYRLRIHSHRFSLYSDPERRVRRGDDVILHLVEK